MLVGMFDAIDNFSPQHSVPGRGTTYTLGRHKARATGSRWAGMGLEQVQSGPKRSCHKHPRNPLIYLFGGQIRLLV
jgi:hypothetical protein